MDINKFMEEHIEETHNIKAGLLAKYVWLDYDDALSFANEGFVHACRSFKEEAQYDPGKWIRQVGILRAIDCMRNDMDLSGYSTRAKMRPKMRTNIFHLEDGIDRQVFHQSKEEDPSSRAMEADEKLAQAQKFENLLNRLAEMASLTTQERYAIWLRYGHGFTNVKAGVIMGEAGMRMKCKPFGTRSDPIGESMVSLLANDACRKMKKCLLDIVIATNKVKMRESA